MASMDSTKYIYWQDQDLWLGYLQDYPDYWTQGESLEYLQSHLRDLYRDLTSGEIPGVASSLSCHYSDGKISPPQIPTYLLRMTGLQGHSLPSFKGVPRLALTARVERI